MIKSCAMIITEKTRLGFNIHFFSYFIQYYFLEERYLKDRLPAREFLLAGRCITAMRLVNHLKQMPQFIYFIYLPAVHYIHFNSLCNSRSEILELIVLNMHKLQQMCLPTLYLHYVHGLIYV